VGQHHAVERDGAEALGALVVALLGGGQQRMQHLDRRLEHLDEFQQPLVGQAQPARVAVGVGVVLGELLQLADIDLADQRGDILVVLVTRLGLGDADLAQHRRPALDHAELGDVAVVLVQALHRPRRQHLAEVAARNAVFLLQDVAVLVGREQRERRIVHRRALDRVERRLFHQMLELFRQRGLAAAHRPQQVEDLLLLLQPLGGVAEVGDDLLDRVLHAVEILERRIDLDDLVGKDAREARILPGIHQFGLADGGQHALGGAGVGHAILLADRQEFLQRVFLLLPAVAFDVLIEQAHDGLLVLISDRRRTRCNARNDRAIFTNGSGSTRLSIIGAVVK
jgi:hypothetical protein